MIDMRGAAGFAVHWAGRWLAGAIDVTDVPISLHRPLDGIRIATASRAQIVWMDEAALDAAGVAPGTDGP